jgi:hypothetical protein
MQTTDYMLHLLVEGLFVEHNANMIDLPPSPLSSHGGRGNLTMSATSPSLSVDIKTTQTAHAAALNVDECV